MLRTTFASTAYVPDASLIASDHPRITRLATIAKGAALPAGAMLGRITATKKLTLSTAAANDGSQVPYAILAEPVDPAAADIQAAVYFTGDFNAGALLLGAGHTADSIRDGLRAAGIFI